MLQLITVKPQDYFAKVKGSVLTNSEKELLKERIQYAKTWLDSYAPEEFRFSVAKEIPEAVQTLSEKQREYLHTLAGKPLPSDPEALQIILYDTSKEVGLSGKEAFQSIYTALLGKPSGPKAAWLMSSLDTKFVKDRFGSIRT